jgi:hypothetical protein
VLQRGWAVAAHPFSAVVAAPPSLGAGLLLRGSGRRRAREEEGEGALGGSRCRATVPMVGWHAR